MAALIGNRSHAKAALDMHLDPVTATDPAFRKIGNGAFRTAYLHEATGVVYKVDGCGGQWSYTNTSEVRNARNLAKIVWERVRIPKVSLFTFREAGTKDVRRAKNFDAFVVAMEFVDGPLGRDTRDGHRHPGFEEFRSKGSGPSNNWRCSDMHGANFIIDKDGFFVPIDLAS